MAVHFPEKKKCVRGCVGGVKNALKQIRFKYNRHSCGRARLAVKYVHFMWPHKSVSYQLYNCI